MKLEIRVASAVALWLFLVATLLSCGGDSTTATAPAGTDEADHASVFAGRNLDLDAARSALDSVDDLQLLDVRTQDEWDAGFVDGAVHIPIASLEERIAELDSSRPVLVYCAAGGRSAKALKVLERSGFRDVAHMKPGMRGWVAAGFEVQKP